MTFSYFVLIGNFVLTPPDNLSIDNIVKAIQSKCRRLLKQVETDCVNIAWRKKRNHDCVWSDVSGPPVIKC